MRRRLGSEERLNCLAALTQERKTREFGAEGGLPPHSITGIMWALVTQDLRSWRFDWSATALRPSYKYVNEWAHVDLNHGPHPYQGCALTGLSYGPQGSESLPTT